MQSKVTVELQTDSSVQANQSTGCLWMTDSKGDRLAQKGGQSQAPTNHLRAAHTHTHTKPEASRRQTEHSQSTEIQRPLTLCCGSHAVRLPASIAPPALVSRRLTLSVIRTQPNVVVWYGHKGSFSGTVILLRSSILKRAQERKGIKGGLFFCLAAYVRSSLLRKDFHRINKERKVVKP